MFKKQIPKGLSVFLVLILGPIISKVSIVIISNMYPFENRVAQLIGLFCLCAYYIGVSVTVLLAKYICSDTTVQK